MPTVTVDLNETPYIQNYRRRQGVSLEEVYHFELKTGTAYVDDNLSACTVKLNVEKSDGTAIITDRAITPAGTSFNELTIAITAVDTAAWEGSYNYEVTCVWPVGDNTFANGFKAVLVAGVITVEDVI